MKCTLRAGFLAVVLSLTAAALAQDGTKDHEASSQCPPALHAHPIGDNDHVAAHGPHLHVGVDDDRNGDGTICGFHVGRDGNVHVHTDNDAHLR